MGLLYWPNWPLRRLLPYWTQRRGKRHIWHIWTNISSTELIKYANNFRNYKIFSLILQNCIESTAKDVRSAEETQDDVLAYEITRVQFGRRMLALKSQLREKIFTYNNNNETSQLR